MARIKDRIVAEGWWGEWVEIGKRCSAGRRSLWMRCEFVRKPGAAPAYHERNHPPLILAIELKAGREGGDAGVRIERSNPQFVELLDVLTTAEFAATS